MGKKSNRQAERSGKRTQKRRQHAKARKSIGYNNPNASRVRARENAEARQREINQMTNLFGGIPPA